MSSAISKFYSVDNIKSLRVEIDGLIQRAYKARQSSETTLAWRSLQMGKAWLGKVLEHLGTENPYPKSDTVEGIPPTADVMEDYRDVEGPHLKVVNELRDDIGKVIKRYVPFESVADKAGEKSLTHLTEARMWLGFELQRLREAKHNQNGGAFVEASGAEH